MFWADRVTGEIISSGKYKPYHVDDMFTPSGFAHIGSLRGPLIHDVLYKVLREKGYDAEWTYVMNDFDVIDGLPEELENKFKEYMAFPLRKAPSPKAGYESFADFFSKNIQEVLKSLGVEARFLSSWDMYHSGKFNDAIRIALDKADKIQDIYEKVSGSKKRSIGWLPLQVVCENCGRLGTTRVFDWDGKTVSYKCEPNLVKWAQGCGHEGRISPFDGAGKLPWKVDWPAHWKVLGITIEGAGKDHASAGGSYDIAMELCQNVFNIPHPFKLPYEFFLLGGKKMSSSKGIGLKAKDLTTVLPAEVARFLFIKTEIRKTIEFDPEGTNAIPDLFDDFQEAAEEFANKQDTERARAFELSNFTGKMPPKIRFSTLAQWVQMPNIQEEIANERAEGWAEYAKVWLDRFAPEKDKFEVQKELPENAKKLSEKQKKFLQKISDLVSQDLTPEDFQTQVYESSKELELKSQEAFSAIYKALIGKDHGPKAAWLVLSLDKEFVKKRFSQIAAH